MADLKEKKELVYIEIIKNVKMDIARGKYKNGARLPSVRNYAKQLGVNPNTVQKALLVLEDEGYLYTKRTAGRFVTNNLRSIRQLRDTLSSSKLKEAVECMKQVGYSKQETLALADELYDKVEDNVF